MTYPHERADGTTPYGYYSGRDWRDDALIAALLDRVAGSYAVPLTTRDRSEAYVSAFVLRQRMAWAQKQLEKGD